MHDRAMRESGHDTTYRLLNRAASLDTVALNSLLYQCETDVAGFEYVPDGGFGWTNASVQVGLRLLRGRTLAELEQMIAPEWTFAREHATFQADQASAPR